MVLSLMDVDFYDECEGAAMLQDGVRHVAGRGRDLEPMGAGIPRLSRLGAWRDPSILGGITTFQNAT